MNTQVFRFPSASVHSVRPHSPMFRISSGSSLDALPSIFSTCGCSFPYSARISSSSRNHGLSVVTMTW